MLRPINIVINLLSNIFRNFNNNNKNVVKKYSIICK